MQTKIYLKNSGKKLLFVRCNKTKEQEKKKKYSKYWGIPSENDQTCVEFVFNDLSMGNIAHTMCVHSNSNHHSCVLILIGDFLALESRYRLAITAVHMRATISML